MGIVCCEELTFFDFIKKDGLAKNLPPIGGTKIIVYFFKMGIDKRIGMVV